MDLSALVIHDIPKRLGSLPLSLMALQRWSGGNTQYRSINAVLGLSVRTTAVRGSSCLGWWSTHGCDRFLIEAAAMFGMRLRPVHPPAAAVGLADHGPFDQHFEASYAPLIRAALDHGQPVLAWCGWPDARASLWGIITTTCDDGIGFAGTTMWSHEQLVALIRPPIQLYIVEEIRPRHPDNAQLLRAAVSRFRAMLNDRQNDDSRILGGVAAYDEWLRRLTTEDVCPSCSKGHGKCHVQHARFICSDRASAVRFFEHHRDGAEGRLRAAIEALIAECRGPINALATSRDPAAVDVLIDTPRGREALAAGVQAAKSFESAVADALNQLAEILS